MFSDVAKIYIKAGDGGNGRLSFLHEKYREFGGPDGGDGGDGGNVVFQADDSWNTLYFYKTHRKLLAENGEVGKARKRHGKNGQDLIIKVPIGTAIYNDENNRLLADLDKVGSEAVIAKGGEGGFGNAHFTSSTRQTPAFAELGTKGESFEVRLEMKLIADVGLVGLPNIGKSTLLSVVTSAKPKIADYPFTTIIPNLGVVEGFDSKGFVIADIPGLIAGASSGKGLGDEFLRHVERTRVLIHLIDALSDNPSADFETISQELEAYDLGILEKPQILAFSRIDLLTDKEKNELAKTGELIIKKHKNIFKYDKKPYLFSSVTHLGLEELIREVDAELSKIPKETKMEVKTFTIADVAAAPNVVEKIDNKFVVTGPKLEKFAQKTDFSNEYAVLRLYDIMKKTGIIKQIEKKGGRFGDKIEIIGREIDYRG
jgi:GTP-binding protein